MGTYTNVILDMISQMKAAQKVVIYGAKKRAELLIPVCETFVEPSKIQVVVSKLGEGKKYVYEYKVHEINDVLIDHSTIILIAMGEQYFDEISHMPQVQEAGHIIYLEKQLVIEVKKYAVLHSLKKVGINLRLFEGLSLYDFIDKDHDSLKDINSINAKSYELATIETVQYVVQNMRTAKTFLSIESYHAWLKEVIKDNQLENGINLEFGVAWGNTLRKFAGDGMNAFYGFDSFEGLPEKWMSGYEKGRFRAENLLSMPNNVELIKGWYDTTLPIFVERQDIINKKADFIHIDCDLYSSTKVVFENISQLIRAGTIIAFDEYFNYPGWKMDEFKAFQEYVKENHIQYEYLAYNDRGSQVCVKILT